MAGTLHAEEKEYKTAFSYFYESFENFETVGHARAEAILKCELAPQEHGASLLCLLVRAVSSCRYMLLCKIMMNSPEEVAATIAPQGAK